MKTLSNTQVVLRIAAIVASVEFVIMLLLEFTELKLSGIDNALVDILLLTFLSTPLILILVIKPFVQAKDEFQTQLHDLAHTDHLTQLPNRRAAIEHLEKFIASSSRTKRHGAIFLFDLDGFKDINDTFGHDAGDVVLIEVAKRLKSRLRIDDIAGRLGGDEFIVIANNLGEIEAQARVEAEQIAQQLLTALRAPIIYNHQQFQITASVGIKLYGLQNIPTEKAIIDADTAMYNAKKSGKACLSVFTDNSAMNSAIN
jgi:diguanylate cyclase (GGDEF)-like protein